MGERWLKSEGLTRSFLCGGDDDDDVDGDDDVIRMM